MLSSQMLQEVTSEFNGLKKFNFIPPMVSKQGWTLTWKPHREEGTYHTCGDCLGTRFQYRYGLTGKPELRACVFCKGRGIRFYPKKEHNNK